MSEKLVIHIKDLDNPEILKKFQEAIFTPDLVEKLSRIVAKHEEVGK